MLVPLYELGERGLVSPLRTLDQLTVRIHA